MITTAWGRETNINVTGEKWLTLLCAINETRQTVMGKQCKRRLCKAGLCHWGSLTCQNRPTQCCTWHAIIHPTYLMKHICYMPGPHQPWGCSGGILLSLVFSMDLWKALRRDSNVNYSFKNFHKTKEFQLQKNGAGTRDQIQLTESLQRWICCMLILVLQLVNQNQAGVHRCGPPVRALGGNTLGRVVSSLWPNDRP